MEKNFIEMESLIKKAVADLLDQAMMQSTEIGKSDNKGLTARKQMLVLIPEIVGEIGSLLKLIDEKYECHDLTIGTYRNIGFVNLKHVKNVLNLKEEASKDNIAECINKFDCICLLAPGIKLMEKIALGDDDEFISKLVIYALLHGKSATVMLDFNHQQLGSSAFSKKIEKLLDSLEDMMITVESQYSEIEKDNSETGIQKELLTQQDIDDMWKKGIKEFRAGRKCIITPLARDRAKDLGFEIK